MEVPIISVVISLFSGLIGVGVLISTVKYIKFIKRNIISLAIYWRKN